MECCHRYYGRYADYFPAQIEDVLLEEVEQAIKEAQHGNNQPAVKE